MRAKEAVLLYLRNKEAALLFDRKRLDALIAAYRLVQEDVERDEATPPAPDVRGGGEREGQDG